MLGASHMPSPELIKSLDSLYMIYKPALDGILDVVPDSDYLKPQLTLIFDHLNKVVAVDQPVITLIDMTAAGIHTVKGVDNVLPEGGPVANYKLSLAFFDKKTVTTPSVHKFLFDLLYEVANRVNDSDPNQGVRSVIEVLQTKLGTFANMPLNERLDSELFQLRQAILMTVESAALFERCAVIPRATLTPKPSERNFSSRVRIGCVTFALGSSSSHEARACHHSSSPGSMTGSTA